MGVMKDRMIDQMNQDWEEMYRKEQAYLDAERQYNEEMLWLELQKEEEYIKELEQAKIIVDHVNNNNTEIQETAGSRDRLELPSSARDDRREESIIRVDGADSIPEDATHPRKEEHDSADKGECI